MIKQIGRNNLMTSPFAAVKAWELSNVDNQDAVLLEPLSQSILLPDPETLVAVDYITYDSACVPLLNTDCNIALEQQDSDLAIFEEGVSGSGLFTPANEDQNINGTYKRLVYDQMEKAFYNLYRNPLQIFGAENIDFPLSKTDRYLANRFLMFSIPRRMMGDRLVEASIRLYDNSLDDAVEVRDDGNQNLLAGFNLFSKIQEVRHIENIFPSGVAPLAAPTITASQTTSSVAALSFERFNNTDNDMTVLGGYGVVVGKSGRIYTTTDGTNFNSQVSNTTKILRGIAHNGSLYVVAGVQGACVTSPDGATWTLEAAHGTFPNWNAIGVAYNGTQFYMGTDTGQFKSSTNGASWTLESTTNSASLSCMVWSGTQFVIGGQAGEIETSPDGIVWTNQNSGTGDIMDAIAYGGGLYVAGTSTGLIIYSSDAVNWTPATTTIPDGILRIAYGDGYFALVTNQSPGRIWYSTDGDIWTEWTEEAVDGFNSIMYYDNLKFIVSGDVLTPI